MSSSVATKSRTKVSAAPVPTVAAVPAVFSLAALSEFFGQVRWADVLAAADSLAELVADANKDPKNGGKPTAVARAVGKVAPSKVLTFRTVLAAYAHAKAGDVNPTQRAELAAKLPALATGGKLSEKSVSFGGIVLPPIVGEL